MLPPLSFCLSKSSVSLCSSELHEWPPECYYVFKWTKWINGTLRKKNGNMSHGSYFWKHVVASFRENTVAISSEGKGEMCKSGKGKCAGLGILGLDAAAILLTFADVSC